MTSGFELSAGIDKRVEWAKLTENAKVVVSNDFKEVVVIISPEIAQRMVELGLIEKIKPAQDKASND